MPPPEAKLLSALLGVDSYEDAAELLRAAPVPLGPAFCEGLLRTVLRAEEEGDPDASRWRRAYDLVQEYRYRNPELEHFAPAAARAFVAELTAQGSEGAMLRFLQTNSRLIDAEVVGALMAYPEYAESPDPATADRLHGLARYLIGQHGLVAPYAPPSTYQRLAGELYGAFQQGQMPAVAARRREDLGPPLAYTLVLIAGEMRGAGQLTPEFVYFLKALAMHLTKREIGGDDAVDVGAYIWRYLLTVYDPERHTGDYALALQNLALAARSRGDLEAAERLLERWLALPVDAPEVRMEVVAELGSIIERGADAAGGPEAYRRAARVYREHGLDRLFEGHPQWLQCAFLLAENTVANRGRSLEELLEAERLLRRCDEAWSGSGSPQAPLVLDLLGAVLLEKPGDRSENVEAAIGYLERAAEGLEAAGIPPRSRAIVRNRLGHAYRLRIAGDPADNVNSAIQCFRTAAALCPPEVDLDEHLRSITNLAMMLGRSDELDDIRQAIGLLDRCLEHDTPEARPLDHATDLLEKANLHMRAADLGAEGELEAARLCLEAALEIPAIARDAVLEATLRTNYGALLFELPELPADAGARLREAAEAAEATGVRRLVASARYRLGRFAEGDPETAVEHFRAAIEASEAEIGAATSREQRLHVERTTGEVYEAIVAVLVDLGRDEEALDYLERNKARSLREMIAGRAERPSAKVPAELAGEYETLSECVRQREAQLRLLRFGRRPAFQELAEARRRQPDVDSIVRAADVEMTTGEAELAEFRCALADVAAKIRELEPEFDPRPGWSPLTKAEIAGLLEPGRVVVELMVARRGLYLFAMALDDQGELALRVFHRPLASRAALEETIGREWLEPYRRYREAVVAGGRGVRKLRRAWRKAIERIGPRLAELLGFDEVAEWLGDGMQEIVFVPYQLFHVLPLHLLDRGEGRCLCDEVEVGYAPSLRILGHCQSLGERGRAKAFVAQNPDGSLVFSNLEVRLIEPLLGGPEVFAGEACSRQAVQAGLAGSEIFHYSGHAYFDLRNPLASALVMADRRLNLGEILAMPRLERSAIVVLSACETNQVGHALPGDEYSGLPGGFLYAGAPRVLGSLWVVEDNSAPLFMRAFYRAFVGERMDARDALRAATKALREVTAGDILKELGGADSDADPALGRLLAYCETREEDDRIFDHPEHWGAFNLVGAG